jgi:hypothetical protein
MLIDAFLCKREVLGKRAPHSFTPPPPSKCGRCVQHIHEIIHQDRKRGKLPLDKCAFKFEFGEREGQQDHSAIFSFLESLKRA